MRLRKATRRLALLVLAASIARPADAQVELIVRTGDLQSSSTRLLDEIVRSGLAVAKTRMAGPDTLLLRNVLDVEETFPTRQAAAVAPERPTGVFRLSFPDSAALQSAMVSWSSRSDVRYAITNHRYSLDAIHPDDDFNDTYFDSLTHLQVIRAPEAWTTTRGSPNVRIGVIDTGVFMEHPDLVGQFWINEPEDLNGNGILDEGDLNGIDDDGNGYVDDVVGYDFVDRARSVDQGDYLIRDPDASEDRLSPLAPMRGGFGHGTLVAGVVSAALDNGVGIAGVAPGARLVPIRAFGIDGLAEDDDVAAAIVYAADVGIDVINLSFGDTYYSPLMADAIKYANAAGTIVVASGGNVGSDDPHYPSDYPESIGALWLDRSGENRGSRASYGVGIDVGAPGSLVFTTLLPAPDEGTGPAIADSVLYGYRSGSSVSAPQVAGAAALLRSVDPELTPASVRSILTANAVDLEDPGWDHRTAAGRLDIAAALGLPYPASVEISSPDHDSGFSGDRLEITGSAVSSLFDSYSVWYRIDRDGDDPQWQPIAGPFDAQKKNEVLATWDVAALADTAYILRLEVALKNGQSIEDRRRVFIDRSEPIVERIITTPALDGALSGIQVELTSDDLTTAQMTVRSASSEFSLASDRNSRRHGHTLVWTDQSAAGGLFDVEVIVSNLAGLSTRLPIQTVRVPAMPNPGFLTEDETGVPAGYLLPKATDIDSDGLPEIVFNRYREGWLGDTVRVSEWAGNGFRTSANLLVNAFPRDAGDTDFDGNPEILFQVSAVTQVAEISQNGTAIDIVFVDTAGITNPGADSAAWGALLTDLDGDGRGEVVTHNRRAWRLFEYRPGGFELVATLDNPTPIDEARASGLLGTEANGFAEPQALAGDFDRDGRGDLLVTDTDGDFIVFEATGDDSYEAVWYHLTPRFTNRGSRMAEGDFDGDGMRELVGYTHSWPDQRLDGEYDAPYGIYYFFESEGDNEYAIRDSIVVAGEISNHGSIVTIDFDGDDADEAVIAHPPQMYVLKPSDDGWDVRFHRGDLGRETATGIRSIAMTPGDFDLDGTPDIIVAGADETMRLFEWSSGGTRLPTPEWTSAIALDAEHVRLRWRSGSADSVRVFRRIGDGSYRAIATTTADSLVDEVGETSTYVLRSWFSEEASAVSTERTVRPHDPLSLISNGWVKDLLTFGFDGQLPSQIDPTLVTSPTAGRARTVQTSDDGRQLLISFRPTPAEGDTVYWPGLTDSEGTLLADRFGLVPAAPEAESDLFLNEWEALSTTQARLQFNKPLDANAATSPTNYRVDPSGSIAGIDFDPAAPDRVLVDVAGRALGPTGLRTSIVILDMLAADGSRLSSEGTVATFVSSANSLSEAYVFPNPFRLGEHGSFVMIAGLPNRATIEIFSPTGSPIRSLEEVDGDGGTRWDLTDNAGTPVESGVYLIRIESESEESIILKSAVIR